LKDFFGKAFVRYRSENFLVDFFEKYFFKYKTMHYSVKDKNVFSPEKQTVSSTLVPFSIAPIFFGKNRERKNKKKVFPNLAHQRIFHYTTFVLHRFP